ncbi:MAG: hypothetical protein ACOCWZ_05080 [Spirochaetota bacterium]
MKKVTVILMSIAMVTALIACGSQESDSENMLERKPQQQQPMQETPPMGKDQQENYPENK